MAASFTRISHAHLSNSLVRFHFASTDAADENQHVFLCGISTKCGSRNLLSDYNKQTLSHRWLAVRKHWPPIRKARKILYIVPFASADDNIAVNGTTQANAGMEEMRAQLNQSLQGESLGSGLVQSIHDAARAIELAILEHGSSSKTSWFSKAWFGVDKNEWVKTLSYQAAVYALLQAVIDISSRGDRRGRYTNILVQRSLLLQCAPLENIIRVELSTKQPAACEWFWSHQSSKVIATYVNLFEKDLRFTAATTLLCSEGESSGLDTAVDITLLTLALSCLSSIKKLGSAKLSCSQFFSMVPDTVGRLMDMLLEFLPIRKTYYCMTDIGLRREFLFHFGPRAAIIKNKNGTQEIEFWIDLVQNQLQRAIDREKIWSRLTTCESIEVLKKDLAIFGFFIALGRSTQSFLSANGVSTMNDQIEGIIRYLIGGSVLYYPQLSSISSYQLFVEVVCEELEWLCFYQSNAADAKLTAVNKGKPEGMPHREAISLVLEVCSYWMTSFIKYSAWLESPSNIKAARFLSKGHSKLIECMNEVGITKNRWKNDIVENRGYEKSETYLSTDQELDSFDKFEGLHLCLGGSRCKPLLKYVASTALESVEEALTRLEDLLQELNMSNSNPEHLKAACSDLERMRKLKKEASFLEASFRAKAASLEPGEADGLSVSSGSEQSWFSNTTEKASEENESAQNTAEREGKKPRGFWSFLVQNSTKKAGPGRSIVKQNVKFSVLDNEDSELNEIRRFELLRRELMELERRVQRSTDDTQNEEESEPEGKITSAMGKHMVVPGQKKDDVITKSIEKIKETGTDVLQGTQLLGIDVAAAMVLLIRSITGDELTEKEKKALRRTLTDLASVLPIGFLMLLPVTAVGHAAMLAAIQRYVPALIPSTYCPERLDLLRQLEKVKELETAEISSDEMTEAITSHSSSSSSSDDPQ